MNKATCSPLLKGAAPFWTLRTLQVVYSLHAAIWCGRQRSEPEQSVGGRMAVEPAYSGTFINALKSVSKVQGRESERERERKTKLEAGMLIILC